uniref:Single-stranded DNA-binding protein n=1 Tax=Candidatus Aschnera chinzeii TaxID=1485666 RepID=A0AAT9G3V3_9ENTR|nr:MAG: hypothetical protein ACHINZ_0600 [Candidatus Aschnera chinzeii]
MSRGINKVILIGNLGKDPEIRYIPNGSAIANLSLATSESWRDKQTGEIREKTEWHRVVIFGKLAEIASEYLRKGTQVYIEGSLQTRKWQDQDGQDRYYTEVIVNVTGTMQMLGARTSNNIGDDKVSMFQEKKRSGTTQESNKLTNVNTILSEQFDKLNKNNSDKKNDNPKDPLINFDDDDIPF